MSEVRTRFAPSPTGWLHVGGIRTALFAWLIARQANGKFILRLEDTDQAREVSGADEHIMDSLKWLGLDWDEGPFRQSQRLELYKKWAERLAESGKAYADPFSPDELNKFRDQAKAAKKPFLFRDFRPDNPPKWDGTMPLRLKSEPKIYKWHDAVMGDLSSGPEAIDDFILMKSDGFPTYNFAHIIDDYLMNISHVIRSQEFVSSIPRYLNLYEALGFTPPIIATLPYVLGPDGKKKLSKRDGAKDVLDYDRDGYLSEALFNFLVTLGWNDGTTQEIFSRQEILEKFSIDRVQTSGAKFDEQRLIWMNGHYIRQMNIDELYERSKKFWPKEAEAYNDTYKKAVLGLIQERLKYFSEIPELTRLFFVDFEVNLDLIKSNKKLGAMEEETLKSLLVKSREVLSSSDFSVEDLTNKLNQLLEDTSQSPGILFSLIRIATTWAPASPALADSLAVLGKDRTLKRLDNSIKSL
jgi:glutamyl-tRNA synthetase